MTIKVTAIATTVECVRCKREEAVFIDRDVEFNNTSVRIDTDMEDYLMQKSDEVIFKGCTLCDGTARTET